LLPIAKKDKQIHLGYGLFLKTNNVEKNMRTLFNATSQSYSILTLVSATDIDKLITKEGLENSIQVTNIIHDCIYFELDDDINLIKWLNDNIVKIMTRDFIHNQTIHLKAELDIGYDLYNVTTIPNNADTNIIKEKRNELR
jgi:hypothetical protein